MSDKRYKQLGNYIELVQERNKGAHITNLMGVSIAKKFIPSIANIIGTDLSTYRIVHSGNFAFCPVTSRNGEKITIARYKGKDDCIISQAYLPFRVIDENELDPDYLMMWVMRPEFDRYARFHSHGSVRELFSWEEMCNVYLPIPSIEEQRKIVAEYQAVEQRIENNNRLIKALEDTAQAIYHHTFVENIDPENLPEGWRWGTIADFGTIITGKTPSTLENTNFGDYMPFITIPDMHDKAYILETERKLSTKGVSSQKNKTIPKDSICVSCIGTPGLVVITTEDSQTNQQINSVLLNNGFDLYYLYLSLKGMKKIIAESGLGGSVLNNLNKADFEELKIILPCRKNIEIFYKQVDNIFQNIKNILKEQIILSKTKYILLSKLS